MAYATIEEATEYFAVRLFADAWDRASNSVKPIALAMAARAIDRLPLSGWKTDPEQSRAFPRYPDTSVPEAVKHACCEEALAILAAQGESQRRKLQAEGVTSVTVGSVSETYAGAGSTTAGGSDLLSREAKGLLRPWLLGAVGIK